MSSDYLIDIEPRIADVEKRMADVEACSADTKARMADLEVRLGRLEKDFEINWEQSISFRSELGARFAKLETSFAKLWATVISKSSIPWKREIN